MLRIEPVNARTKTLEKALESKRSCVRSWRDKSIDVFNTSCALVENQSVTTMIIPAMMSNKVGVDTFADKNAMLNSSAETPEAFQASNDCQAAIGTPIKLTRSFPAKARASEKVPTIIILL